MCMYVGLSPSLHVCEPLNRCTCVSLVRRSLSRPRAVSRSPPRSPRRPKRRQQPAHCQNCECGSERGRGHSQQAEGGAAPKRGFPLHPRVVAENTTVLFFRRAAEERTLSAGDLLGSATEAWNAAGSLAWQARVPRTRLARASALARVRGPGAWSTCACSCARSRRVSYVYPRGEACVWPRSRCRWRRMRRFVDQRVCMCRRLYAHVHASMHACLQLCV